MDWLDSLSSEEKQSWDAFVTSARQDLIPKMSSSTVVVSLVPENTDIKFAVELGLSIMMDKPIIAVATTGTVLPVKLVEVADHIIFVRDLDTEEGREELTRQIMPILSKYAEH